MIVKCPNCRKPISSKAVVCGHCSHELGEVSEEQLREVSRRQLRDRVYRLKMMSYAAITLLLAGAGWYFYESADLDLAPSAGPIILAAIGSVAYVIVRGLLFMARRELRSV